MSTQTRDREPGDSLPVDFNYDKDKSTCLVTFGDGEQILYYDIDPRSAFLDSRNQARGADFVTVANLREINPYQRQNICRRTGTCQCPYLIKREQIQGPTTVLPEPETRPVSVSGQNSQATVVESSWPWPSLEKTS